MTMTRTTCSRRALLFGGPLAVAAASTLRTAPVAARVRRRSPAEFKARLAGPICSSPTPFNARFQPDHDATRRMVARALHYGVPAFALTAGNSQYFALTYEEIRDVTRVFVEAVDGRALTIAATGAWWTERTVDYCRYAESVGADAVQVLTPQLHAGEDSIVAHFRAIARSTKLPIVLHGNYSESLLEKLVQIESIVAMKEDLQLTYYIDRAIKFGDRLSIFAGGAENRFLVGHPYGSKAFYSVYTSFAPDIAMRFWQAIQENDLAAATALTTRYDYPYIKDFTHALWHATLEYFGIGQRYLRPPQHSYTDAEMAKLKELFDRQGLHPENYR